MRKITGSHGGLFSKSTAAGLVLLLVLAGWPPTAVAKIRLDWSKVQAVKPGTPTRVVLYKDQAPRGSRKIKGYFYSATDDSITLERQDGQRHTFPKWAVRKVLKHRPLWKRYQAWTTAMIGAISWVGLLAKPLHIEPGERAIFAGMMIVLPTLVAFAVAPGMGGIYNVPPKYRMQPPTDRPSDLAGKATEQQQDP